ncbi:MAG: galactokinase family protein, partial [Gemmatimonadota bacterium]
MGWAGRPKQEGGDAMTSAEKRDQRSAERAAMAAFRRAFEDEAVVAARAPGRVVLVGEDTCG